MICELNGDGRFFAAQRLPTFLVLVIIVFCPPLPFYNIHAKEPTRIPFVDFNDFPATGVSEIPGGTQDWIYTSATTNPDPTFYMTGYDSAGWRSSGSYPTPNATVRDIFYSYRNTYNSSHMGFETYGYLEIDQVRAVTGNSLRFQVTGGKNVTTCPDGNSGPAPCNASGLPVSSKEAYLDWITAGYNPIDGDMVVGHPYIYFANTSPNDNPVPFLQAPGSNRLSLYVMLPESVTNGTGENRPPEEMVTVGPYNGIGGHWYHRYSLQGGGWAHLIIDGHPQHNNAWSSEASYPYPSRSLRDMDTGYFNGMYRWYLSAGSNDGLAVPSYSIWLDDIKFQYDEELQNTETIASPTILYRETTQSFEIGFMDKYKNNGNSHSTYEVRYAFSEITNQNWDSATPVEILQDDRFGIAARSDGRFQKWHPYYQNVWAPFRLVAGDELSLTPGSTVWFAIKDVSQVGGDSMNPVDSLNGVPNRGGRDYFTYGDTFDYAGDAPVLGLIRRIDYQIPKSENGNGCPVCSGDRVVLEHVTFPDNAVCECQAGSMLEIGAEVVMSAGCDVVLRAPSIRMGPGLTVSQGATLRAVPESPVLSRSVRYGVDHLHE